MRSAGCLLTALFAVVAGAGVASGAPTAFEIVPQSRHVSFLKAVTFAGPAGERVVTAGDVINVWDTRSHLKVRSIRFLRATGRPERVLAVASDPEGTLLFVGGDSDLCVFDLATGRLRQRIPRPANGVNDLDVSADGKSVISAGYENAELFGLDPTASAPLHPTARIARKKMTIVYGTRFLAGGARFALREMGAFAIGETASGRILSEEVVASETAAPQLAVSRDGKLVGFSTARMGNNDIQLRDLDGKHVGGFSVTGMPSALDLSPDGRRVAVGGFYGLAVRDARTGQVVADGGKELTSAVRFDPKGRLLASVCDAQHARSARLLDAQTGRLAVELGVAIDIPSPLAVRPGGGAVAVGGNGAAYVIELDSGARQTFKVPNMSSVDTLAWSPDAKHLWVSDGMFGAEGSRFFDTKTAQRAGPATPFFSDNEMMTHAQYSPDGRMLALGMRDSRVELRDPSTGKILRTLPPLHGRPSYLAWPVTGLWLPTNDRAWVAAGDTSTVPDGSALRLFDLRSGKQLCETAVREHPGAIAPIDTSALVYGGTVQHLRVYDAHTCTVRRELEPYAGDVDWDVYTLTVSPDHRWVYAALQDGVVLRWSLDTGRFAGEQVLHEQAVLALAADPKSGLVVSGAADGITKLSTVGQDGGLTTRLSVVSEGHDDYVVFTADGYYRASRSGTRAVAYRVGDHVVPADRFDTRFNRPDRVAAASGIAEPELVTQLLDAHRSRLSRLGLDDAAIRALESDTAPPDPSRWPRVAVDAHAVATTTSDTTVEIPVEAFAGKGTSLKRITILADGAPAHATLARAVPSARAVADGVMLSGARVTTRVRVPLTTRFGGRNRIVIEALDSAGNESLSETLEVTTTAKSARPSTRYVIALGVSHYAEARYDLAFADHDAESIGTLFSAGKDVRSLVLTNAQVTHDALARIDTFLSGVGVDDSVVLFVAGHGMLDAQNRYWFAAHDMVFTDPARRGIGWDDLESVLARAPAREKLLLVDTCHAGEADRVVARSPSPASAPLPQVATRGVQREETGTDLHGALVEELFSNLSHGSGAQVIVASTGGGAALERDGHGLFTAAVIEALADHKAPRGRDGRLMVSTLRDYVHERVAVESKGRQTTVARRVNDEFDFPIDSAP